MKATYQGQCKYLGQTPIVKADAYTFTLTSGYDNANSCFVNIKTGKIYPANPLELSDRNGGKRAHHVKGCGYLYKTHKNYLFSTLKDGHNGITNPIEVAPNKWVMFACFDGQMMLSEAIKIEVTVEGDKMTISKADKNPKAIITFMGKYIHAGTVIDVYSYPFKGIRGVMKRIFGFGVIQGLIAHGKIPHIISIGEYARNVFNGSIEDIELRESLQNDGDDERGYKRKLANIRKPLLKEKYNQYVKEQEAKVSSWFKKMVSGGDDYLHLDGQNYILKPYGKLIPTELNFEDAKEKAEIELYTKLGYELKEFNNAVMLDAETLLTMEKRELAISVYRKKDYCYGAWVFEQVIIYGDGEDDIDAWGWRNGPMCDDNGTLDSINGKNHYYDWHWNKKPHQTVKIWVVQ